MWQPVLRLVAFVASRMLDQNRPGRLPCSKQCIITLNGQSAPKEILSPMLLQFLFKFSHNIHIWYFYRLFICLVLTFFCSLVIWHHSSSVWANFSKKERSWHLILISSFYIILCPSILSLCVGQRQLQLLELCCCICCVIAWMYSVRRLLVCDQFL